MSRHHNYDESIMFAVGDTVQVFRQVDVDYSPVADVIDWLRDAAEGLTDATVELQSDPNDSEEVTLFVGGKRPATDEEKAKAEQDALQLRERAIANARAVLAQYGE